MRISVLAVGRLRAGPEATLVEDYISRFERAGRGRGIGPAQVIEVEDRRGSGTAAEGVLLLRQLPARARLVALDERGAALSSPEFADLIERAASGGIADLAFAIGGADGLAASVRERADRMVSFGPMVWPHMLARVMLAEQLYRAATILAGMPYHRG